jgi:hypothetical protein
MARMPGRQCWYVETRKADTGEFFRQLTRLFPGGGVAYLEGCPVPEVRDLLMVHPAPNPSLIQKGTTWPRQKVFHIPLDPVLMDDLADMGGRYARPELCDHLVVYEGDTVLLSAYDFLDDVYIADTVEEDRVAEFASALECEYRKVDT